MQHVCILYEKLDEWTYKIRTTAKKIKKICVDLSLDQNSKSISIFRLLVFTFFPILEKCLHMFWACMMRGWEQGIGGDDEDNRNDKDYDEDDYDDDVDDDVIAKIRKKIRMIKRKR